MGKKLPGAKATAEASRQARTTKNLNILWEKRKRGGELFFFESCEETIAEMEAHRKEQMAMIGNNVKKLQPHIDLREVLMCAHLMGLLIR